MARIARLVVPGFPHHVTQRGNRRMTVFFSDDDYALTLYLLAEHCRKAGVEVWSYCLMPNHVHLILTPSTPQGLGAALGETHRRYSGVINARLRVAGHLVQACYGFVTMDEADLMVASRTIALNRYPLHRTDVAVRRHRTPRVSVPDKGAARSRRTLTQARSWVDER